MAHKTHALFCKVRRISNIELNIIEKYSNSKAKMFGFFLHTLYYFMVQNIIIQVSFV